MAQSKKGSGASARSTAAVERQRAEAKGLEDLAPESVKGAEAPKERSFEYDGVTYTVGTPDEWSVGVLEGIEDNHMVVAMRELLGPAQWTMFKSKKRTGADFYEMVSKVFEDVDARAE